jgi:ferrous iron transport protein B
MSQSIMRNIFSKKFWASKHTGDSLSSSSSSSSSIIQSQKLPLVALAGSPNAGKSVLFNALTGLHQKVGNYPGVTVERKMGFVKRNDDLSMRVIDLPGTYSLNPISVDETIATQILTQSDPIHESLDAVIAVVDASNLERTLGLVLELKSLGKPLVVALNMMDLAERRGLKVDVKVLAQALGLPVIPLIATKNEGVVNLLSAVKAAMSQPQKKMSSLTSPSPDARTMQSSSVREITERFHQVDQMIASAVTPIHATNLNAANIKANAQEIANKSVRQAQWTDQLTWKLDRVFLHPFFGPVILLAVLMVMFQGIFSWASPLADGIDGGIQALNELVKAKVPNSWFKDLITDGIISGVGGILVFLPQIMILFTCINLLEASGYMTRAAFMLDRLMAMCGLQGRSFVPLLSSFACAIPGVMATRTIRSERDRLVTMMVAPLMTCSARLPVYTLLIAAFVPSGLVFGFFDRQALTMMGLFAVSIVSAFAVAFVTKLTGGQNARSPFLLEMPTYRMPQWSYIATSVWLRCKAFIQRAGTIILASSVAIWFLSTYPKAPENADQPAITYSFAGQIGHTLEPLFKPIGFDWRIATGLIPGLAAREVMVSALATVFAVESKSGNEEETTKSLEDKIKAVWSPATGFALLAWYIYAPQCMSTLATVRRESGRTKWAVIMAAYMFALAWVAAFVTFKFFSV